MGLNWPAEHAIVAAHEILTEAGEKDKAAQALASFLAAVAYIPSARFLDCFISEPAELGAGLAMVGFFMVQEGTHATSHRSLQCDYR